MKKFNMLVIASFIVYLIIAICTGYASTQIDQSNDQTYRIEINRVLYALSKGNQLASIDLHEYESLTSLTFLDINNMNKDQAISFFREENMVKMMIQPYYVHDTLMGYLKFTYRQIEHQASTRLFLLQGSLCFLALYLFMILFYMRKHIIRPFMRLSEMPMELAKGHYKTDIKLEKSKYLHQYLWGMGQLQDVLKISNKRQLALLKEKKKLLLSLSHDIKTPLNLIRLYEKALEDELYEDKSAKQHALSQIKEKAIEIEQYVETIIQSSREDILDLPINAGEFYLDELMQKVLTIYNEQCRLRSIQLIVNSYENRMLKGDMERVQEVFENLFENAFKYGDGRRIELTFYEEDYCQLIRVFNTGNVIADHEFPHLFDSFFRASNAQRQQGSGLGLYICRELMNKMDGAIFAEKHAEGMSFILVFR